MVQSHINKFKKKGKCWDSNSSLAPQNSVIRTTSMGTTGISNRCQSNQKKNKTQQRFEPEIAAQEIFVLTWLPRIIIFGVLFYYVKLFIQ